MTRQEPPPESCVAQPSRLRLKFGHFVREENLSANGVISRL